MLSLHYFGLGALFCASILLIAVSVSVPVWHQVYFLHAELENTYVTMGTWGVCFGDVCSKTRIGYNLASIEENGMNGTTVAASLIHGLTYALIIHPIAAGLTMFALLVASSSNVLLGIVGSILSFWAYTVTLIIFIIDLILFVTARHRLNQDPMTSARLGNGIWIVLASLVLQLFASFTVCLTHKHHRRTLREREALSSSTQEKGLPPIISSSSDESSPAVMVEAEKRDWMGRPIKTPAKVAGAPVGDMAGEGEGSEMRTEGSEGGSATGSGGEVPLIEKKKFWDFGGMRKKNASVV